MGSSLHLIHGGGSPQQVVKQPLMAGGSELRWSAMETEQGRGVSKQLGVSKAQTKTQWIGAKQSLPQGKAVNHFAVMNSPTSRSAQPAALVILLRQPSH